MSSSPFDPPRSPLRPLSASAGALLGALLLGGCDLSSDHGACSLTRNGVLEQCVDYTMVGLAQREVLGATCMALSSIYPGVTLDWKSGASCTTGARLGGCRKQHTTSRDPYWETTWQYPHTDSGGKVYTSLADVSCSPPEETKLDANGNVPGADLGASNFDLASAPSDLAATADLATGCVQDLGCAGD